MAYSSGIKKTDHDSLDQLQINNYEHIAKKLSLNSSDRLLDLGCGWGGLVCYLAKNYGVQAMGITYSENHYQYVLKRIKKENLEHLITVKKLDILHDPIPGTYTKITSIEMYEHVRIENLPKYFSVIDSVLEKDGRFLIQSIVAGTGNAKRHKGHEFMDKYIFPGAQVPNYETLKNILSKFKWKINHIEDISDSYVLTLGYWLKNLLNQNELCLKEVSERIYRLWMLYLAGSIIAFEERTVEDYQTLLIK
jgi:cyclopropane-fatty-acyl-phospholipid synthase